MRVLQASSEIFPLLKTGGLADVAGALPAALASVGCEVRAVVPGFPAILDGLVDRREPLGFHAPWGEWVQIVPGRLAAVRAGGEALAAYVLDAPGLYARPGNPYEDAHRVPYADNHRRFAALGWAAAHLAHGIDPAWRPDLVHCHDWHAGLAAACLRLAPPQGRRPVPSVYTVHNLAYQGLFDANLFPDLGLPGSAFQMDGLEFHGRFSFMKAGLYYADAITTVSPTYAREIQSPEQGCGLDGLLRSRSPSLHGILNGVDREVWDPATDAHLARRYDIQAMRGKAACKAALQREAGLDLAPDAPLFSMVSRLTEQKGVPLVLGALSTILQGGGQLLVLGSGDAGLEKALIQASQEARGRVAVRIAHDEDFAHRVFGGSDVTLVPSQFEPCGLTQMYGLLYGSLPLVRGTGGLADTVVDADLATLEDGTATGFVFHPFTAEACAHAVRRALALYRRPALWDRVRRQGMAQDLHWSAPAARYLSVYRMLMPDTVADRSRP